MRNESALDIEPSIQADGEQSSVGLNGHQSRGLREHDDGLPSHEPQSPELQSHATDHPHGELEFRQVVQGRRPGERYVRIARHKGFKRVGHGLLVPRPE